MPCDRLCSRGFYQAWPEGFLLSSTSSLSARRGERKRERGIERERENQQCSVKSPLLINEYFLSREGKERKIEKRGRLHPWARAACMAEFLHCASQRRSIREHEREGERDGAGGSEESGGWFTQAGD